MKKHQSFLTILILISFNNLVNAQAPGWLWARSAGAGSEDIATSVTTDALGNAVVTGYFVSTTITFGSFILTNSNPGTEDIFLVKYNQAGLVQWAKSAGGSGIDIANSVATDAFGNIIITGNFKSPTINFGSTVLTNSNPNTSNLLIAKYDPTGTVLWANSAGGVLDESGNSVCTDLMGNLIVAGYFKSSTISFGNITLVNAGSYDMLIVKYDINGNSLWAHNANGYGSDFANSVTADAFGNVIVVGTFSEYSFIIADDTINATGAGGMFIAKYNASGIGLWANSAFSNSSNVGNAVCVDAVGNLVVVGSFNGPFIKFGNITLFNFAANIFTDIYLVKYDTSGNVLWANSAGGSDNDEASSVTADASGNIIVVGDFTSPTITFGITILTNAGFIDLFIVKYDQAGNVLWAQSVGDNGWDEVNSVTTNVQENVFVTGAFYSTAISFGTINLINASTNADMYIAKLSSLTGITEPLKTNTFSIAPNPFSSQTTITFSKEQKNTTIKIMDIIGKEIHTSNFSGKQLMLEKGIMHSGIYFFQTINKDGVAESVKMVIE